MIWAKIFSWLTGGVVDKVIEAYAKSKDAQTEQERIAAQVEIEQLRQRQANLALGGRFTSVVQFLWAAPFIAFNAKLIIWDKMLGWGVTDPLSDNLMTVQSLIVGFYFGSAATARVIRSFRS